MFDASEGRIRIASYRDIQFFEDKFLTKDETTIFSSLTSDVGSNALDFNLIPKVFGPEAPTRAQKRVAKGNRSALNINAARLPGKALVTGDDGFMETDALGDPKSYKAAPFGPHSEDWAKAESKELDNMLRLKVFKPILRKDLPKEAEIIPLKWVYKTKYDADALRQFKARMVARDDRQSSTSYGETFAPVSKMSALRLLFAFAVQENLAVRQWDFIAAFLQAERTEHRMFCAPPHGCKVDPNIVWEALMALYGSCDSANLWNTKMRTGLESVGWTQLATDLGVYRHKSGAIMGIWVDDCVICAKPSQFSDRFLELSTLFEMKDLGQIRKCLGMEIIVNPSLDSIFVNQTNYANEILEEYGMLDCSPRRTPLDPSTPLLISDMPASGSAAQLEASKFPYRRIVGKLMYLMLGSRPDLAHAVGLLSRFSSNPGQQHILGAKHVLRYVAGTSHYGLRFTKAAGTTIRSYSDADWGGDESRKSTTGYVYMCSGTPVSWASKLQKTVALSTTEAEYYAISETIREGLWLHSLANELRNTKDVIDIVSAGPPLLLFGDNKGSIDLAKKSSYSGRTKHIDIRHAFIKDHVLARRVKITYIPTGDMIADCLTKSVSQVILERNLKGMGLSMSSS